MQRILVVDDDVEICRILRDFLTLKGYEVSITWDGVSALQQVKAVRPHIVLLDITMPGMDGITTLQEIKKIDATIGVIMITAVIDEDLAKRAITLGAYEYITKPVDFNYLDTVLMVIIADLLGSQESCM